MPYFNNEHNDNEHIDYNTDDQLTEYDTDNEGDDIPMKPAATCVSNILFGAVPHA